MPDIALQPLSGGFAAVMAPPGSKSLSNRAMVLAAMARGRSILRNVLLADDTRVMIDGLQRLGYGVSVDEPAACVTIDSAGAKPTAAGAELFCGNSGTTIRFLAALCSLGKGDFVLDGVARMRQRPIGELVDLLRQMGVRAMYLAEAGFPPVRVHADGLPGGIVQFGAAQSSQFLSAVLMVSPAARHEVTVDLVGPQTSWPYVAMTMRMMDAFGLTPELVRDPDTAEPKQIVVPRGEYQPRDFTIEPDASNATYFMALAAVHPGSKLTIRGLGKHSLQGDIGFADLLKRMGAGVEIGEDFITIIGGDELWGIDADLSTMPDTAQTLAVTALFATDRTTLRGLHTLRVKETDRLAALSNELTKLGAGIEIEGDTLHIDPPKKIQPAHIETYEDHRMAMSFAVAGTKAAGVVIKDAQCVNKTYPGFFSDLAKVMAGD
jgi:3-phosphoshikimate 1-carboxyvinyltransferase